MVGRMGGGLHFVVEIELEMAKMPAFTNLKQPRRRYPFWAVLKIQYSTA